MKKLAIFSRIFVGLVFIFSGFVKGIDPMGTAYKLEDYFVAYQMTWLMDAALILSILLCVFEFALGVLLVLNVKIKLTSWLVFITMIFFTILTFYDALENPVPDCGCFGEAIILTNWETFYKNLVLMFFTIVLFMYRKSFVNIYTLAGEWIIIVFVSGLFAGFSYYNYSHLPLIDFRSWKVGNRLVPENPKPLEFYITYRNKETGEKKEYLSQNIPWKDSLWVAKWEYVSTREHDPNEIKATAVAFTDLNGNNVTDVFIRNPEYQFLLMAYDLEKAGDKKMQEILELYNKAEDASISFACITSSSQELIRDYLEKYELPYEFYFADDTSLEMIIRSNPGLVLLKNSVIIGKWHYNDFPAYDDINFRELEEKYLQPESSE